MIKKLKKEDGSVVEGEEELGLFITNHYKSLFTTSAGVINNELLSCVPTSITMEMNERLTRLFTTTEVKHALDSIGDLKAPGRDGMSAVFYKKFLGLVGDKVQAEVLEVLNGGQMPMC